MQAKRKCLICETRPRLGETRYCQICQAQLDSENRKRQTVKPVKYLVYQEHVIGIYPNGSKDTFTGRLLKRSSEKLPKGKTLNLNEYCKGFNRSQIKTLKAKVLKLANA